MQNISATSSSPSILNTLRPPAFGGQVNATIARPNATGTTSTGGSSSNSTADGGIGSTFLSLLSQELQNQDPTAPVDSTAMVGQMISLSQLGQLISIDQAITAAAPAGAKAPSQSPVPSVAASSAPFASANGTAASTLSPSTAAALYSQLPFDPSTMMPRNFGSAAAAAASINSTINTPALGFSGTNNNTAGGK